MKNTYLLKLKELKFSFNPQELIDYQFLLSLYYEINQSSFWEELKEEVYDTLEILINVYSIDEIYYSKNLTSNVLDLKDIKDLSTYIYIFMELYKDMEQNNFNISAKNINNIKNILTLIEQELQEEPLKKDNNEEDNNSCIHNCLICSNKCYSDEKPLIAIEETQKKEEIKFETHILDNCRLNPQYLKEYLIRKNKIEYKCNRCGLKEWQNEPLLLYLNYKDYNCQNQKIDNLEFLCPNCYSQIGV